MLEGGLSIMTTTYSAKECAGSRHLVRCHNCTSWKCDTTSHLILLPLAWLEMISIPHCLLGLGLRLVSHTKCEDDTMALGFSPTVTSGLIPVLSQTDLHRDKDSSRSQSPGHTQSPQSPPHHETQTSCDGALILTQTGSKLRQTRADIAPHSVGHAHNTFKKISSLMRIFRQLNNCWLCNYCGNHTAPASMLKTVIHLKDLIHRFNARWVTWGRRINLIGFLGPRLYLYHFTQTMIGHKLCRWLHVLKSNVLLSLVPRPKQPPCGSDPHWGCWVQERLLLCPINMIRGGAWVSTHRASAGSSVSGNVSVTSHPTVYTL